MTTPATIRRIQALTRYAIVYAVGSSHFDERHYTMLANESNLSARIESIFAQGHRVVSVREGV